MESTAARNYVLGLEVAECARLIKGYGDTHARGIRNYAAIMGVLQRQLSVRQHYADDGALPRMVRTLRTAALADEDGKALAQQMAAVKGTAESEPGAS